jgi:hypothetical protein
VAPADLTPEGSAASAPPAGSPDDPGPDHFETAVTIYLAGNAAVRRALRGSTPGWRVLRTPEELRSFHEAGHGVLQYLHGQHVWRLSIIINRGVRVGDGVSGGFAAAGDTTEPPADWAPPSGAVENDVQRAARACLVLSNFEPPYGWRSALRIAHRLRAQTRDLVHRHWPLVARLAAELAEHGELNHLQIARILKPRGI